MTSLLEAAGEALYGADWKPPTCDLLQVNGRRLRHWLADPDSIPAFVWPVLREALKDRREAVDGVLLRIWDAPAPESVREPCES